MRRENTDAGSNPQTGRPSNLEPYEIARQWNNLEVVTEQETAILKRILGLDPAVDKLAYVFTTIPPKRAVMMVKSRGSLSEPRFFTIDENNNHFEITAHQARMHRLEGLAHDIRISVNSGSSEYSPRWQTVPDIVQSALNEPQPLQETVVLLVYNKIAGVLLGNWILLGNWSSNADRVQTVEQTPSPSVNH